MEMTQRAPLIALLALTVLVPALPAYAQSDDERYTIMRPEKGATPRSRTVAGAEIQVAARHAPACGDPAAFDGRRSRARTVPPPLYVPQTGQIAAESADGIGVRAGRPRNLAGPRRALRASGRRLWPGRPGDRNAYIGSCINQ